MTKFAVGMRVRPRAGSALEARLAGETGIGVIERVDMQDNGMTRLIIRLDAGGQLSTLAVDEWEVAGD